MLGLFIFSLPLHFLLSSLPDSSKCKRPVSLIDIKASEEFVNIFYSISRFDSEKTIIF